MAIGFYTDFGVYCGQGDGHTTHKCRKNKMTSDNLPPNWEQNQKLCAPDCKYFELEQALQQGEEGE